MIVDVGVCGAVSVTVRVAVGMFIVSDWVTDVPVIVFV